MPSYDGNVPLTAVLLIQVQVVVLAAVKLNIRLHVQVEAAMLPLLVHESKDMKTVAPLSLNLAEVIVGASILVDSDDINLIVTLLTEYSFELEPVAFSLITKLSDKDEDATIINEENKIVDEEEYDTELGDVLIIDEETTEPLELKEIIGVMITAFDGLFDKLYRNVYKLD